MPAGPRESFAREQSPDSQEYETALLDLISLSFQRPKENGLSAKQHWAMKLNRKVEDFKKLKAKQPTDRVFKPFKDFDAFVEDASKLARSGDSVSFISKWPISLLEAVKGSLAKKESLGYMAIEKSPLLTLAEAADAVERENWPLTEAASSTRISGMAARGSSASEVDDGLEDDGSTTPRAGNSNVVPPPLTHLRGYSRHGIEQHESEPGVADMFEEREVQSAPPYVGNSGPVLNDLLQHSASNDEGRTTQLRSGDELSYGNSGLQPSGADITVGGLRVRRRLKRNSTSQKRSRAGASVEFNQSSSVDPDARHNSEGSRRNLKHRFPNLERGSEDEAMPVDTTAPVENNAQDCDHALQKAAEITDKPERKRRKLQVVIPFRFVSPSKRDSKQRPSLKVKAGQGRGRGLKSAKSKSRARPLSVKADTSGGPRIPARRKRITSTKRDGDTQAARHKEVVAVPVHSDKSDDEHLGEIERESDRQLGDTQHNPPCANCAGRDLSCFTETDKLFGTRCRRCVRIKKHCSYSRIPLEKLKEKREKHAEEEREDDVVEESLVDDVEWTGRQRRTRASTRAQTTDSVAKCEERKRKRGTVSDSRSISHITIRASSHRVFEETAQIYDEAPQPMAPPKIIPGPRIHYRPKSESPDPNFHPFTDPSTRPPSLSHGTSPTPFPPPSLSQSLSVTPAPFPPASISDIVGSFGRTTPRFSPGADSMQMSTQSYVANVVPKPEEIYESFDEQEHIDYDRHGFARAPLVDYPSSSALIDSPLNGHDEIEVRVQRQLEEERLELEYVDDYIPVDADEKHEAEPTSADSNWHGSPNVHYHDEDGGAQTAAGNPQDVPTQGADNTDALSLIAMMSRLSDTPEKLKALRDLQQAFGISKDI